MAGLAGVANLLPTSMVTGVARSQAARMDFATSNLRGAKVPLYISGAAVEANYPFGPLAGTAFNLTTMSLRRPARHGPVRRPGRRRRSRRACATTSTRRTTS